MMHSRVRPRRRARVSALANKIHPLPTIHPSLIYSHLISPTTDDDETTTTRTHPRAQRVHPPRPRRILPRGTLLSLVRSGNKELSRRTTSDRPWSPLAFSPPGAPPHPSTCNHHPLAPLPASTFSVSSATRTANKRLRHVQYIRCIACFAYARDTLWRYSQLPLC